MAQRMPLVRKGDSPAENADETAWWVGALGTFAKGLASAPIVECESQILPASAEDGPYVDFIVPRLLVEASEDETNVERLWPLVAATKHLVPPTLGLAKDWTLIAEGWRSLGTDVSLISLEKLADRVRADAETLDQLGVRTEAKQWLAAFVDVVGECWSRRAGVKTSALEGMMPNQNLYLCSPSELKRDLGVSESLKCICTSIEYDVREHLLLDGLDEGVPDRELHFAGSALIKAIPEEVNEEDVVAEAVRQLGDMLPDGMVCDTVAPEVKRATALILAHLWETQNEAAASIARQLPLLASSDRSVRWSQDRLLLAPVDTWRESAQPFKSAYPPDRVLSELYTGFSEEGISNVTEPLVNWGIAHADPIIESTVDLREPRLGKLSADNTEGLVVSQQRMSQIALLAPEVLNRCQENQEDARAASWFGAVQCGEIRSSLEGAEVRQR